MQCALQHTRNTVCRNNIYLTIFKQHVPWDLRNAQGGVLHVHNLVPNIVGIPNDSVYTCTSHCKAVILYAEIHIFLREILYEKINRNDVYAHPFYALLFITRSRPCCIYIWRSDHTYMYTCTWNCTCTVLRRLLWHYTPQTDFVQMLNCILSFFWSRRSSSRHMCVYTNVQCILQCKLRMVYNCAFSKLHEVSPSTCNVHNIWNLLVWHIACKAVH